MRAVVARWRMRRSSILAVVLSACGLCACGVYAGGISAAPHNCGPAAASACDGNWTLLPRNQNKGDAAPIVIPWLQGWPMAGHDPQHTNRSIAVGPLHPQLVYTIRHQGPVWGPLVGPDGRIYVGGDPGVSAYDAAGTLRWSHPGCCGEGPFSLTPSGILVGETLVANQRYGAAAGVRPDGQLAWRIQPAGLLKGAATVASADGSSYFPFGGPDPAYMGLDVLGSDGREYHRVLPGVSVGSVVLGQNGAMYVASRGYLYAVSRTGTPLWEHYGYSGPFAQLLVGLSGDVYRCSLTRIVAYSRWGRLAWRVRIRDQVLAVAERADGSLLSVGRHFMTVVSSRGHVVSRVRVGRSTGHGINPAVITDAAGTAYVTSGDATLRVISSRGEIVSSFVAGPANGYYSPEMAMGPDGRLLVVGTDGVLRVYGESGTSTFKVRSPDLVSERGVRNLKTVN